MDYEKQVKVVVFIIYYIYILFLIVDYETIKKLNHKKD